MKTVLNIKAMKEEYKELGGSFPRKKLGTRWAELRTTLYQVVWDLTSIRELKVKGRKCREASPEQQDYERRVQEVGGSSPDNEVADNHFHDSKEQNQAQFWKVETKHFSELCLKSSNTQYFGLKPGIAPEVKVERDKK